MAMPQLLTGELALRFQRLRETGLRLRAEAEAVGREETSECDRHVATLRAFIDRGFDGSIRAADLEVEGDREMQRHHSAMAPIKDKCVRLDAELALWRVAFARFRVESGVVLM